MQEDICHFKVSGKQVMNNVYAFAVLQHTVLYNKGLFHIIA